MHGCESIKNTEVFLKRKFDKDIYLKNHPEDKAHRLEHT